MPDVWRIRDRRTFVELRRAGHRARSGPLTVTWLPDRAPAPPRVAYAVGRGAGSAVHRNRLRRRLRAQVRDLAGALRPGAYLIGASGGAHALSPTALHDALADGIAAAHQRASTRGRG